LDRFLDKCRRYFVFFMHELGGVAMTPLQIMDVLRDGALPVAN
jgi:hypothetical protein